MTVMSFLCREGYGLREGWNQTVPQDKMFINVTNSTDRSEVKLQMLIREKLRVCFKGS